MWVNIPSGYRGRALVMFLEGCGYEWDSISVVTSDDGFNGISVHFENVVDKDAFEQAISAFNRSTMFLRNHMA